MLLSVYSPTAGVTGKGGMWWKKPPEAESTACPGALAGSGVGQVLKDDLEPDTFI